MRQKIICAVLLLIAICNADVSFGKCPDIEPMPDFNIHKFLGRWYVIQKTHTSISCITYNITLDEEHPNKLTWKGISQHGNYMPDALRYTDYSTVDLDIPDQSRPALMETPSLLDLTTKHYVVFMADYDNYAAIFKCKKIALAHKWTAEILSRTPHLDLKFVDKIRTRLSSYNIDPLAMSFVKQADCEQGFVWNIATNLADSAGRTIAGLLQDPRSKK